MAGIIRGRVEGTVGSSGQTSIEYLMTYGWIGLISIIGISVLYTLIQPTLLTESKCVLPVGFACYTWRLEGNESKLTLWTSQFQGVDIRVIELGCTQNSAAYPFVEPLANPVIIKHQERGLVVGGTSGNTIHCRDPSGNIASGQIGVTYHAAKICFNYLELPSLTSRLACGDFAARYE